MLQEHHFKPIQESVWGDYVPHADGWFGCGRTFPYISMSWQAVRDRLQPLLHRDMRIVDVGCGAGDKLILFHLMRHSLQITGIEHHPTMAAFARYAAPFAHIIEGDALQQDYSTYDLIYMYSPIADRTMQFDLQERCRKQMKRGAMLICFYQSWGRPKHPDQHIYPSESRRYPDLSRGWRKP